MTAPHDTKRLAIRLDEARAALEAIANLGPRYSEVTHWDNCQHAACIAQRALNQIGRLEDES